MQRLAGLAVVSAALSILPTVHAGTVINSNLSGNAVAIANINARADGAQGGQDVWNNPFSSDTLPSVTVPAGTYFFRIINPTDAATAFPALTTTQQAQLYSGWTYNSPWIEDYLCYVSTNHANQLFDGAPAINAYGSAAAAYAGAFTDAASYAGDIDGSFNNLRLGTRAGTILNNPPITFTATTTLEFAIPDNGLSDNNGGVSVLITSVPEPTSAALFLAVTLLGVRRSRRTN